MSEEKDSQKGTIRLNKSAFTKYTPAMAIFIGLHESAHKAMQKMPQPAPKDYKKLSEEYFAKFPLDEKLIREFLYALKEQLGYFKSIDPLTCKLEEILTCPEENYGFQILSINNEQENKRPYCKVELLPGQTSFLVSDMGCLSGGVYSFITERIYGKMIIIGSKTHVRS